MKNNLLHRSLMKLMIAVLAWCACTSVVASDSHTATKDCFPTPCTTTGTGSFAIATPQIVRWSATHMGDATDGNDFYLSTSGPNMADIAISTSLSPGFNSGEFFLAPGNYFIAINTALMGPGAYTIEFNLVADCNVNPLSFNFGDHDAGSAGDDHSFTISLAGDDLDVTIGAINGTDNAHFVIAGGTGTTLSSGGPTSVNFTVQFVPGNTPGIFSSTINITTTNPNISVPDKSITVTGETLPLVPDINCVNSAEFVFDWFTGVSGTFNKSFRNDGNETLNIMSIDLGDNPGGVFTLNGAPVTTPLADGSSRAVSIRFTPPDGEATYTGSIIIVSNSPGETNKECFFTARAHHPEPIMEVSVTPDGGMTADYHDVETGFTFTKGIRVRNTGDAPLNLTLSLVDATDPDVPQWSERQLANNVNIAAGSEQIFLQRFTPQAPGTYTIAIEAHGTGGGGTYDRTDVVTLTGNGINPIPIDNVLVLDRSGSMADPAGSRTKIDAMQKAARLYYDLLRADPGDGSGDQIGMVKYSTDDAPYLDPIQMKNATNEPAVLDLLSEAAISDPSRLQPDGSTCIGCGMETGASMLVASPDTRKQVMVVMTDGIQNEDPEVGDVIGPIETANPDLMIYSIGLGDDIEEPTLQQITNVGNGYHQVSEDLLGINHFALEEFYFKIWANATGADLIVDPTEGIDLSAGVPVEVNRARVVSSDRYAVFMVLDDPALASYYKLEFIDPHGTILDPTSSVGGIPIQILQRSGHTIYKIIFPDISQAGDYVGDWILRLNPTGKWKPGTGGATTHNNLPHQNYNVPGEWIQPYQGIVPIGFGAAVKSDYTMQVAVAAPSYVPGADVLLTATLSDRGWHSTGGHIEIQATRPNNSYNNFLLYDDGTHGDTNANDGVYSNHYNNTALEGSYKFFFNGMGINERGELVPRQATRYISLFAPGNDDGGNGGDPDGRDNCFPCWLHYLILLLLLILLILIIRCCRRMSATTTMR